MFYVGIDIAKKFNVAFIVDDKDKVIKKSFKFNNDEKGFNNFLELLLSIDKNISNFTLAMEATGLLFENLYLHLKNKGYNIILLNPYQTSKFREMDTMKKVKNDIFFISINFFYNFPIKSYKESNLKKLLF
jgi:transposase